MILGNQMIDQPLVLHLAEEQDFLTLVHMGFITLPLFDIPDRTQPVGKHSLKTLREYGVFNLRNLYF